MQNNKHIIVILDEASDDYYLLWECFSGYSQFFESESNPMISFSKSLRKAYELQYFDFYQGENFNGDEIILMNFETNDIAIERLLNWKAELVPEIRIRTSNLGIEFLNQFL